MTIKVNTFMNNNNQIKINKDLTTTYNNKIKQIIKENKLIFTNPYTNTNLTVNNKKPPTPTKGDCRLPKAPHKK